MEPNDRSVAPKWAFVLLSNTAHPQPSTRISVLNMLPYLRQAGVQAEVVFEPALGSETPNLDGLMERLLAQRFDLVFFQKVRGASVYACVTDLSKSGIRTVYGVCDKIDAEMVRLTDRTVVVTEFLRSTCEPAMQHKVHVVHDGIEKPEHAKQDWGGHVGSRRQPLRAVLVTSANLKHLPVIGDPPDWLSVTIVGHYPANAEWRNRLRQTQWALQQAQTWDARISHLRFLANRRIVTQQWQPDSVYAAMLQADIGILPIDTPPALPTDAVLPTWQIKSENRLTLKMAIGLPVIATPIPSYEPVLAHGHNGFFARSRADWIGCLETLRQPAARSEIGRQARDSVIDRFSIQAQARLLLHAVAGDWPPIAPTHTE